MTNDLDRLTESVSASCRSLSLRCRRCNCQGCKQSLERTRASLDVGGPAAMKAPIFSGRLQPRGRAGIGRMPLWVLPRAGAAGALPVQTLKARWKAVLSVKPRSAAMAMSEASLLVRRTIAMSRRSWSFSAGRKCPRWPVPLQRAHRHVQALRGDGRRAIRGWPAAAPCGPARWRCARSGAAPPRCPAWRAGRTAARPDRAAPAV